MTTKESAGDTGALLTVFATLLLDSVNSLDETVGQVTDLVIGNGQPSREMIVTLQSFDRLKQEFEALAQALTRYVAVIDTSGFNDSGLVVLEQQVVAGITVGELKERFLNRLRDGLPDIAIPRISDQELASVGIDVVY